MAHPELPPVEAEAMTAAYPVVVERGPDTYGAYAPGVPGTFVTARTLGEARRLVRKAIATSLRLFVNMGDDPPAPRPEVARALARATDPGAGLPTDPRIRIIAVHSGPENAPPDAHLVEPPTAATERTPRAETFAVVFEQAPENWCAYLPDLPGCVSTGDTLATTRRNIHEALSTHAQSLVDDGAPLPSPRTSSRRALELHHEEWPAETDDSNMQIVAEPVTVQVFPPRPEARVLNIIRRDASERQSAFEKTCAAWMPLLAGESWTGAYAATMFRADGVWYGSVTDLPLCNALGATRHELRQNLRAAIAERLLETRSVDGEIPLPRRTIELAIAHHNLHLAELGDDDFPDPDVMVEMVPVEITAPSIACAS